MGETIDNERRGFGMQEAALNGARHVADTAGKTAMAAVLAGTIAAGAQAVTPDQIHLPDPVPIVQVIDMGHSPDAPDDSSDEQDQTKSMAWKKALKFLLYVLVAMAFVASVAFGALQGCVGCTGSVAVPSTSDAQEQQPA